MTRLTLSIIALIAGGITALGFAPTAFWPATLIGVAGLAGLVGAAPTRSRAFITGWLFGVGMFGTSLTWIATAFTFQAKMPAALGWVAVIGLAMFLALYTGLAAWLARALARDAIARAIVLAAAWMLGEWLRGWVLSGFAWNPLGAATLPVAGLAQWAAFIGALGLSGLVVLASASLWAAVEPRVRRGQRLGGIGVLLGVAGLALVGTRLNSVAAAPGNPDIVIVQPNIGQDVKYEPGADAAHLQTYLDMTQGALAGRGGKPALVLWSESAVFGLVEEDPELRARLAAVLGPRDLLLFGGVAAIRDAGGNLTALTNSLYVLDSGARILGRYDKSHLVPLGEYVPARALMETIGIARLAPGDIDFQPGPGPRTLPLPGFPAVGGQVCYEIIFAGAVIDAENRPQWIANISNDAWFGPTGPPQHLDQARLRAIEEGVPVARATPTGISAIVDARGGVVVASRLGEAAVVTGVLPAALPVTVFAQAGHWASLVFGLGLLAVGLGVERRFNDKAQGPRRGRG